MAKETYSYVKKRPTPMAKETYFYVKRDLVPCSHRSATYCATTWSGWE